MHHVAFFRTVLPRDFKMYKLKNQDVKDES